MRQCHQQEWFVWSARNFGSFYFIVYNSKAENFMQKTLDCTNTRLHQNDLRQHTRQLDRRDSGQLIYYRQVCNRQIRRRGEMEKDKGEFIYLGQVNHRQMATQVFRRPVISTEYILYCNQKKPFWFRLRWEISTFLCSVCIIVNEEWIS